MDPNNNKLSASNSAPAQGNSQGLNPQLVRVSAVVAEEIRKRRRDASGSELTVTPEAKRPPPCPSDNTAVSHSDLLVQRMSKLYETGTVSDCRLISRDGQEFTAHRAILAAWSPVFASMFATDMTEKTTGVCRVENFDGKVIVALLKFVYTGSLSGIGEFVEDMLDIADQYDMPDLNTACGKFMAQNVTVKTAPAYFHLADRRGMSDPKSRLARFIALHANLF